MVEGAGDREVNPTSESTSDNLNMTQLEMCFIGHHIAVFGFGWFFFRLLGSTAGQRCWSICSNAGDKS